MFPRVQLRHVLSRKHNTAETETGHVGLSVLVWQQHLLPVTERGVIFFLQAKYREMCSPGLFCPSWGVPKSLIVTYPAWTFLRTYSSLYTSHKIYKDVQLGNALCKKARMLCTEESVRRGVYSWGGHRPSLEFLTWKNKAWTHFVWKINTFLRPYGVNTQTF